MLKDLVLKNRTYRRFVENEAIATETLRELVELAQYSATGNNIQPLKFMLANDAETNAAIFPHLGWAARLTDWHGPAEGERPSAYIIILADKEIAPEYSGVDHGIAAQSIMLGAAERGYGGCMMGSVKRVALRQDLDIAERYKILLVLALGKPAEEVALDPLGEDGDVAYWRDKNDVHHVPKRSLDDLIVE